MVGFVLLSDGECLPYELVTEEVLARCQFLKMLGRKIYWFVKLVRVMMSEESVLVLAEIAA